MKITTAITLISLSIAAAWTAHDHNKTSKEVSRASVANTCFESTKRAACGFWMDGVDTSAYRGK